MLIQDSLTGRLHEVPDQLYRSYLGEYGRLYGQQYPQGYGHYGKQYPQGYGHSPHYGAGQVVYDGLGNPVGIAPLLAMLAPLAAKVLPAIATKVLPAVTKVLPAITNFLPGAAPAAMPQPPTAMPPMPDQQFTPSPVAPFPASMPAPITPLPPMAVPHPMTAMMAPRVMMRRRRRFRPIRRRIAVPPPSRVVPPPPEVMEQVREARSVEPSGAVQGWGYHGGFNGYGWR